MVRSIGATFAAAYPPRARSRSEGQCPLSQSCLKEPYCNWRGRLATPLLSNFLLVQTVQCTGQLYRIGIMPQPRGFPTGGHILPGGLGTAVIMPQGDDVIACIEEDLRHGASTLELLQQRGEKVIEDGVNPDECRTVREARCDFPPYVSGAKSCYSLCVTMAQRLIQLLNTLDISGCFSLHDSALPWDVS